MRVLVACEFSGAVRDAFRARGHDAVSCDILDGEGDGPHLKGDVREFLGDGWDLMIAHPPCTHLSSSGARWFHLKWKEQAEALEFVRLLLDAPIPKIAVENPVGVIGTRIRPADQIVHPWMFGDEASKQTCLWLNGLPKLEPTNVVGKGEFHVTKSVRKLPKWYNLPPSPDRGKKRSVTFPGFARAMAEQWG